MKNKLLLILGIASITTFTTAQAVLITDFGTTNFTPTFTDFNIVQGPNQISLDGVEQNLLFGDLAGPINIIGSTESLTITGIYTGVFNGQFVVELFDADGDSVAYSGFYSNFTPSVSSTVNLVFVDQTGSFNGIVTTVGFTAGGTGSSSTDLVITNLSAVPEPGTVALLTGALTSALIFRRRRTA